MSVYFASTGTPGLPKKRTPGACQKGSRAFSSRFGEGRFFPGNKNSFSHPAPKKAFSPPTTRGAFLIQHRGRPFLLPRPHPFFVLSFKNLATPRSQERNPRQPMRHGGRHPRDSSRRSTPTPSEAEHLLAERSAKGRRHSSRRRFAGGGCCCVCGPQASSSPASSASGSQSDSSNMERKRSSAHREQARTRKRRGWQGRRDAGLTSSCRKGYVVSLCLAPSLLASSLFRCFLREAAPGL